MKKINKTTFNLNEDELSKIISWYFEQKKSTLGIKNIINDKIKLSGYADQNGEVQEIFADYTVQIEENLEL